MNRTLLLLCVLSSPLLVGCSSTTVIKTRPSGAIVRNVAGEKICRTPCSWSGSGTINATDTLTIEKPGYEETTVTVRKDQVNGLAIAGLGLGALITSPTLIGIPAFVVPMFWMADYKPVYEVELDRVKRRSSEDRYDRDEDDRDSAERDHRYEDDGEDEDDRRRSRRAARD